MTAILGSPYKAPPIFEAVVELRFEEPIPVKTHERLTKRMAKLYDESKTEQLVDFEMRFDGENLSPVVKNRRPFSSFTSSDQADVLILNLNSFVWSRLAPYEGWSPFAARIERDLIQLSKGTGPQKVSRLGLRYRNRIDVPAEDDGTTYRYEKYLTAKLDLPDMLDPLNGYEWRVQKSFPDVDLTANVGSAVIQPELPEMASFLLDIDVFDQPATLLARFEVLPRLAQMRTLKNEIFERSITDSARASFN